MDCCNTIALTPVCAPRDLSIHASLVFFSLSGGFNRPETTASVKSFSTLPRGLVHSKMLSYKVPPGRLGVDQLLTVSYRLCGTLLYHCSKETSSKLRILLEAQVLQYPHHSWQKQHRDHEHYQVPDGMAYFVRQQHSKCSCTHDVLLQQLVQWNFPFLIF